MERLISFRHASLVMYSSTMTPALELTLLMLNTANILDSNVTSPSKTTGIINLCCNVSLLFIQSPSQYS